MPRYGFTSPGGNIVDSLAALREQKRIEARQAMLDELERQRTTSALDTDKVQRRDAEQRMLHNNQQMEIERLGVAASGLEPQQEPDPENAPLFKKYGLLTQQRDEWATGAPTANQVPNIGEEGPLEGPIGPTLKPTKLQIGGKYLGTQKQRDDAEDARIGAEVMKVLLDPKSTESQKVAAVLRADTGKGKIPAGGYTAMLNSFRPEQGKALLKPDNTYQLPDGTISKQLPPGMDVIRGFQPHPTPVPAQPQWLGPDGDGNLVFATNGEAFTNVDGKRVPFTGKLVGKPSAQTGKVPEIWPAGTSQRLGELRGKAADTEGWNGRKGTDLEKSVAREAMISAIASAKVVDPSIKEAALNVLNGIHPVTGEPLPPHTPVQEIAKDLAKEDGAEPMEVIQFIEIVLGTRGY